MWPPALEFSFGFLDFRSEIHLVGLYKKRYLQKADLFESLTQETRRRIYVVVTTRRRIYVVVANDCDIVTIVYRGILLVRVIENPKLIEKQYKNSVFNGPS